MTTTLKYIMVFIALTILSACNDSDVSTVSDVDTVSDVSTASNVDTVSDVSTIGYETYFNEMNDYTVEYPDYLIAQGEGNQDGERFISEDGKTQLFIYSDYESVDLDEDNQQAIAQVYEQELKSTEGVFNKKLGDTYYIIESKKDDVLHTVYVGFYDVTYFNFRFEYPEKDKKMMSGIISHVVDSLRTGVREGTIWPSDNDSVGEKL